MTGSHSEFQWKYLGFNGVSDKEFAVPQAKWRWQPFSWVLYRIALAIYFTGFWFLILSYWGEEPYYPKADTKAKWPIYLSNWTYFILCLYFCMSAISTLTYHVRTGCKVSSADDSEVKPGIEIPTIDGSVTIKTRDGQDYREDSDDTTNLSWYFKITWLLQDISFTGSLVVVVTAVILYLVYGYDELVMISIFVLQNHGINLVFVFADQFLISSPYRLMHVIYPFIYTWIYFIFSLIYYGAGGTNSYPYIPEHGNTYMYRDILDWNRAPAMGVILMTSMLFAIVPVCHTLFWGMYKLRVRSKRRGRCECC